MGLFEPYPVDPAVIEANADRARRAGTGAVALADDVLAQSQVASGGVTGTLQAPLTAAPTPVVTGTNELSGAAIVAEGCLNRWSAAITAYNVAIEDLNARYESARAGGFGVSAGDFFGRDGTTPAQNQGDFNDAVATADSSLQATLRAEKADLDRQLDDEADAVALLLDAGPTEHVLLSLASGGHLAPNSFDVAGELATSLRGQVVPPLEKSPLDIALWGLGRGGAGAGIAVNISTLARYGRFAPRGANGRYVPIPTSALQRGWQAMSGNNWQARPHTSAVRNGWQTAGTVAKWGGIGLAGVTGGLDQWGRDANRTDLSTTDRAARAGTRGALTAGGAWAGGALGAKAGTGIGFMIGGPPGAAVGAIVGGVVGGVIGSGVANEVADHVVEFADDAVDAAGDAVDAVGDAAETVGGWLGF